MARREESSQPEGLIAVLLDTSAPCGDRHDAAMDLSAFDEPQALAALEQILADPSEDRDLVETCQESVWERKGRAAQ